METETHLSRLAGGQGASNTGRYQSPEEQSKHKDGLCKGPEARTSWVCSRKSQETRVAREMRSNRKQCPRGKGGGTVVQTLTILRVMKCNQGKASFPSILCHPFIFPGNLLRYHS